MWRDAEPVLAVSLSARALARSARLAGASVVALDLHGDVDTHLYASHVETVGCDGDGFDAAALLRTADRVAPRHCGFAFVYGSGFEAAPWLIDALASGRHLMGNDAERVNRVVDPQSFFSLLEGLGVPHPEVSLAPPGEGGWLRKRRGGCGGLHVHPATAEDSACGDLYFQRYQAGEPMSVLFLADGREVRIVGFHVQWAAAGEGHPYRWGGVASGARLPARIECRIIEALTGLVGHTGLRGLNGMDFIWDGHEFHVLEINPRPTAALDLYLGDGGHGLFVLHRRACLGMLPRAVSRRAGSHARAVVYARAETAIPATFGWPAWCSDLPGAGSRLPQNAPICTVHGEGASPSRARRLASRRAELVLTLLRNTA